MANEPAAPDAILVDRTPVQTLRAARLAERLRFRRTPALTRAVAGRRGCCDGLAIRSLAT
jgi:hypothetical protein